MSELSEQLSNRFSDAYRHLVHSDLRRELLRIEEAKPSASDLAYLISTASRLALNADTDSAIAGAQCQLAYDIAVRAPRFANGSRGIVMPLCEAILSRIGNFPARRLLVEAHLELKKVSDPFVDLESAVREEENKFEDTPEGVTLTDFQVRLLKALRVKSSVSVSAPTSAGKSYTLELDLLHRLKESSSYTGIFLVPTRALIRQVSMDLADLMRKNNVECSVLSSLSVPEDDGQQTRKFIFVFTQERFATFLAQAPPALNIKSIVVDEAQEIGKDRRGITLERVIRLATRRFPSAQLFFSSPLRSNPEYLLSVFRRPDFSSEHFVEYQRPVSQNIILVKSVKKQTQMASVEALTDFGVISLGTVELPFKFRDRYLVNLAKYFTAEDEVSIIYCNRPSEADKSAAELSELFPEIEDEVFTTNMYLHPDRLEELALIFRDAPSVFSYCPLQPFASGAYDNLVDIFRIIDQVFIKSNNERYRYMAFLALRWMQGMSIRDLVRARLDFKKIPDEVKVVNEEIRDLFREIEEDLRYLYVKYTGIYIQVLGQILIEKGHAQRAEMLLPIHMFLEFGASERVLINLMSLGLSRTSAILLRRTVSLDPNMTLRECKTYLEAVNLTRIAIPAICRAEIARMRGRSD